MDKYDEQIARLRVLKGAEFRSEIHIEWSNSRGLFQYATKSGRGYGHSLGFGCLTMIRDGGNKAGTDSLTKEIQEDERLPTDVSKITKEHLPIFAEWQRRLDRELERDS